MDDYEKRGYLLENFRLFHLKDAQGTKVGYHYHEFCKLLLLHSGFGSYCVEGQRYVLKPGDVVLIGNGCVHRPEFESGMSYERTIIYIDPEFLAQHSSEACCLEECFSGKYGHVLRLYERQRKKLFDLADALEQEMSGDGYGRVLLSSGFLLEMLVEIGRSVRNHGAEITMPIQPCNAHVKEILQYLDSHFTEDINIDDLAERFYLSKYHMMRLFRRETGDSIHGYLSGRRLMYARDLITQGSSATDACFRSGWHNYSSFTRAYGKQFGTTPTGRKDVTIQVNATYE